MKLKIKEFNCLARRDNCSNGQALWCKLGYDAFAYRLLMSGERIGYEIVKELYNNFGEYITSKIIDFEEESLNEFKRKFIEIGGLLY